jgi:hypothetical protein
VPPPVLLSVIAAAAKCCGAPSLAVWCRNGCRCGAAFLFQSYRILLMKMVTGRIVWTGRNHDFGCATTVKLDGYTWASLQVMRHACIHSGGISQPSSVAQGGGARQTAKVRAMPTHSPGGGHSRCTKHETTKGASRASLSGKLEGPALPAATPARLCGSQLQATRAPWPSQLRRRRASPRIPTNQEWTACPMP